MRRLPLPSLAAGERTLDRAAAHYVNRVLRLRAGEAFEAFDPRAGVVAEGRVVRVDREDVLVELATPRAVEESAPLVLVQGYPKGDKLGDIVRDATELGVTLIVPAVCARSIARPDEKKAASRAERLAAIAAEAARQCGRARAPEIAPPTSWDEALAIAAAHATHRFVLWEKSEAPLAKELVGCAGQPIAFAIGPEGGLTDEEIARAEPNGFAIRSLGRIILRTETAAVAVLGAYRVLSA